jgi:glycosyltransferase involved in cell wall biosynthesis
MLEAMAASVPVVATAVGIIPEAIQDGLSGLLVPPGEPHALTQALTALHDDRLLGQRLGAAGRKVVEESYDIEVTAALMAELYREVLGATPRTGAKP